MVCDILAILDVKLKHLDDYNAARQKAAAFYNNAFAACDKIETPAIEKFTTHIFHQYTLKLHGVDRQKLIEGMNEVGVPVMIYYPVPLHLQKAFANAGGKRGDFPVTELLCDSVVSLPIHTELDEEQLTHITSNFLRIVEEN